MTQTYSKQTAKLEMDGFVVLAILETLVIAASIVQAFVLKSSNSLSKLYIESLRKMLPACDSSDQIPDSVSFSVLYFDRFRL